jgi:hypothetical protein
MALQIDLITSNFGVSFNGAYFRVVTAAISRQRTSDPRHTVMIDVVGYATKPLDEDTKDVDFRRYHASLNEVEAQVGVGFLAKVYAWVASQPDMIGSLEA